jgi:hypothetical protein
MYGEYTKWTSSCELFTGEDPVAEPRGWLRVAAATPEKYEIIRIPLIFY